MNIKFNIDYRTRWGETLCISGSIPELGGGDPDCAVKMDIEGDRTWSLNIHLPDYTDKFEYSYIVCRENGTRRYEWGKKPHSFVPGTRVHEYEIYDSWQDQPWNKPYYSVVFSDCICRRQNPALPVLPVEGTLLLSVDAPMITPDQVLAVCGSCDAMGNWDTKRSIRLSDADYPTWRCSIPLTELPYSIEYKFILIEKNTGKIIGWELNDNRRLSVNPYTKGACIVVSGLRFANPQSNWRGAGVAIPVFSLRSDDDFGVGEFHDLCKLVDWAVMTGQKFIQVLPVNDTTMTHTWTDSYPYNANSCFALHPMYLHIPTVGKLSDAAREDYYETIRQELNSLEDVDYERVNATKNAYTRELFCEINDQVTASGEFKKYIEENSLWLKPYAAYCILRDQFGTPEFKRWRDFEIYDEDKVDRLLAENTFEANYVFWIQMNLANQMKQVREYAHSRQVSLKGDIPIGISRDSVDAWISPHLFNLDCQAGAPPDDFSVLGQNWGFPTYNWEEMGRDGFAWWKARFAKMAEYFDVYRIDHVLGFFRIWQIPMDQLHGLLGIFNPALPFTPEDISSEFDFRFDVNEHTLPYVRDWFLPDIFGEYVDEVKERFLENTGRGVYRLRSEFNTQRRIADYFANRSHDSKNHCLCNGLMELIDQVLFIEDPIEKGKYHPRISAQHTYIYRTLNDYQRWCFDRLYTDFFYHRHNKFWYDKAMWKLPPIIDATSMLTCAEDLGMIPACVPAVMSALEILTLDIQRMPKNPAEQFGNPANYPYYSVCTTSTHDMGGIRQWWEENRVQTQSFFNHMLHEQGTAPESAEPWICEKIVESNLKAPSMLCILPLQDWLSVDGKLRRDNPREEQINIPAISRHYWRYRMHLTLERLVKEKSFSGKVRDLIAESGRL
ncbi:MAG: 4-alpha-glucanotransferase [Bacteroidales bacterium]|nr:4-alpha-glucanotransferase [Bacteroidales bacterium]